MKKIFVIGSVVFALLLCACKQTENYENELHTQKPEITEKVIAGNPPHDVEKYLYEPVARYTTNIISDENEDIITLYTSAQRDMRGDMMWDDTQDWVLQVKTGNEIRELYKQRLHGSVYFNVSDYYNDGADEKVITLFITTNASNEIREYRYNGENFVEKVVYTSDEAANEGIGRHYTSIPMYE
ncbi:MAG: hypothetical protein IJD30_02610 [Clostridia bacterium]|nr:hypothetical protein [Clostridia bacterium]